MADRSLSCHVAAEEPLTRKDAGSAVMACAHELRRTIKVGGKPQLSMPKRARDILKNDPFFRHRKAWRQAIEKMLETGQGVQQQALAKHSLNFVIETYLPQ